MAKQSGARIAGPPLAKIYGIQGVLLLLVYPALVWIDSVTAYSTLLGGLIALGPNAYFARQAFKYHGARAATHVTAAFYKGEVGKLVLTAALFAAVFAGVRPLQVPALFAGFVLWSALNLIFAWRYGLRAGGRQRDKSRTWPKS